MSKIYMVIADTGIELNYEPTYHWWNVGAFASEEAAQEHIQKLSGEISEYERRIDELDDLADSMGLTEDIKKERDELYHKLGRYVYFFPEGNFRIEEYEVLQ